MSAVRTGFAGARSPGIGRPPRAGHKKEFGCQSNDKSERRSSSARTTVPPSTCCVNTWWRTITRSCRRPAPPMHCASVATTIPTCSCSTSPCRMPRGSNSSGRSAGTTESKPPFNPHLPVIVLIDGGADRARTLHKGADDYVQKPFSYDELHARIKGVLRRGHKELLSRVPKPRPKTIYSPTMGITTEQRFVCEEKKNAPVSIPRPRRPPTTNSAR